MLNCIATSCSEDVEVETETSISYTLTISPDLLKFVTPQVSYIDENNVLITLTGLEELDRKVIENSAKVGSGRAYALSTTVGDYHFGDDINNYLDELLKNPDKVGYYVDENGDITRRDEFDM